MKKYKTKVIIPIISILIICLSLTPLTIATSPANFIQTIDGVSSMSYVHPSISASYGSASGQTFTTTASQPLNNIGVYLRWWVAQPRGYLKMYVTEVSGGFPSTVVATASETVAASSLTNTNYNWVVFDFNGSFTMENSHQYAFYVALEGTTSPNPQNETLGSFQLGYYNLGGYAGGQYVYYVSTGWATQAKDVVFSVNPVGYEPLADPSISDLELLEHLEIGTTITPFNPASLKTLGRNNNYQFNGTIFNGNNSLDTAVGLYSYGYTLQSTTDFSNTTMQNTSSEYNYTDGSFKFTLPEPSNDSYMILGVFYTVEGYEGATGYYYYIKWEDSIYHSLPTEAPTTANPQITAFTNDLISFLVALVCIVALGGVLGWKFGLWGFVAGANIGIFLCYLYLGLPIWAVIGILIVDGLLFFALRGKE